MKSDQNGTVQRRRYERPARDGSFGSSAGIIIIATIVFFVVNGPQSNASNRERLTSDSSFSGTAILGGIERASSSPAFRSAEAAAFMGAVKLDFRDAIMEGNEATIDIKAVMGGVDIRVPQSWTVVNRVTPIMGGVKDHTHSTDSNKRVVIEGTVLMGGLEIKN